jgi:ubiquinone/menaquinone biosynthesis C-methylase UbiE
MTRYVLRGGRPGFERIEVLARLRLADTSALLEKVGVSPGWRCLDLGSGSGTLTSEIARRVGPTGRVVGLDMDAAQVDLARKAAADQGIDNVEFAVADLDDWAEIDAFDLVYCGLVLHHLPDPVDLLRRMRVAVHPGGRVVVEDADFDGLFCYPDNDGFEFYAASYREVLRRRGADPTLGRRLLRLFAAAGLDAPQLTLVQRVSSGGAAKSMPHWTLAATTDAILAEGVATSAAIDAAMRDLAEFTADPTTVLSGPRMFQAWSRVGSD